MNPNSFDHNFHNTSAMRGPMVFYHLKLVPTLNELLICVKYAEIHSSDVMIISSWQKCFKNHWHAQLYKIASTRTNWKSKHPTGQKSSEVKQAARCKHSNES